MHRTEYFFACNGAQSLHDQLPAQHGRSVTNAVLHALFVRVLRGKTQVWLLNRDQYQKDYSMELGYPWEHPEVWNKIAPFYRVKNIMTQH